MCELSTEKKAQKDAFDSNTLNEGMKAAKFLKFRPDSN